MNNNNSKIDARMNEICNNNSLPLQKEFVESHKIAILKFITNVLEMINIPDADIRVKFEQFPAGNRMQEAILTLGWYTEDYSHFVDILPMRVYLKNNKLCVSINDELDAYKNTKYFLEVNDIGGNYSTEQYQDILKTMTRCAKHCVNKKDYKNVFEDEKYTVEFIKNSDQEFVKKMQENLKKTHNINNQESLEDKVKRHFENRPINSEELYNRINKHSFNDALFEEELDLSTALPKHIEHL